MIKKNFLHIASLFTLGIMLSLSFLVLLCPLSTVQPMPPAHAAESAPCESGAVLSSLSQTRDNGVCFNFHAGLAGRMTTAAVTSVAIGLFAFNAGVVAYVHGILLAALILFVAALRSRFRRYCILYQTLIKILQEKKFRLWLVFVSDRTGVLIA